MTTHEIRTRDLPIQIRALNEAARTCDFIASTEAIDAYDEIVEQDWILDRFKSNPVILFGHNSRALPIGKAIRCEVVTVVNVPRLEVTIEFATEKMNPEAERVFQLVKGKFLRALSVGFRPGTIRRETRDGREIDVLSRNVLHEISVVTIPANAEALAKGLGGRPAPSPVSAGDEDNFGAAIMRSFEGTFVPDPLPDDGDFADEVMREFDANDDDGDFADALDDDDNHDNDFAA